MGELDSASQKSSWQGLQPISFCRRPMGTKRHITARYASSAYGKIINAGSINKPHTRVRNLRLFNVLSGLFTTVLKKDRPTITTRALTEGMALCKEPGLESLTFHPTEQTNLTTDVFFAADLSSCKDLFHQHARHSFQRYHAYTFHYR